MIRPLTRYAEFSGRSSRSEYWMFVFFQLLVYICLGALFVSGIAAHTSPLLALSVVGIGIAALGFFIPNLSVTVRRLHDSDRSALWLLLYLPSIINALVVGFSLDRYSQALSGHDGLNSLLLGAGVSAPIPPWIAGLCSLALRGLMFLKGTTGSNRFGPDPLQNGPDISVFDDERQAEPVKPPHKPVFDFVSSEPAAVLQAPAPPVQARPPVQPWTPPTRSVPGTAGRPAPAFGKRNA